MNMSNVYVIESVDLSYEAACMRSDVRELQKKIDEIREKESKYQSIILEITHLESRWKHTCAYRNCAKCDDEESCINEFHESPEFKAIVKKFKAIQ